jgi:hypothetical protein
MTITTSREMAINLKRFYDPAVQIRHVNINDRYNRIYQNITIKCMKQNAS